MRYISICIYFSAGLGPIKVKGEKELDKNTPIVVLAPHTTYLDSMAFTFFNFLSFVSRAGNEKLPIFGECVKSGRPIVLSEDKSSSATQQIIDQVEQAEEARRRDPNADVFPVIGLFVQRTCSTQDSFVRFKTGAFIPGRPVQPVCVRYPGLRFDSISWVWEGY